MEQLQLEWKAVKIIIAEAAWGYFNMGIMGRKFLGYNALVMLQLSIAQNSKCTKCESTNFSL